MRQAMVCLVMACWIGGCGSAVATRPDYMSSQSYKEREPLVGSLFASDQNVLSDQAVETILSAKIVLPARCRIAVLPLRDRGGYWYGSDEWSDHDGLAELLEVLRGCDRVVDASALPALMVPAKVTIPYLREAAARLQADMLLVYRTRDWVDTKERLLAADEVQANVYVEAVLLDVRTGVVPFTAMTDKSHRMKKSSEDFGLWQTGRRATVEATTLAIKDVGSDLAAFLAGVSVGS